MNRIINIILTGIEWFIPLIGITRLRRNRIFSVILAAIAHLVPLIGCIFAAWDPVTVMLAYWIELAFMILVMLVILIIILVIRVAEVKKVAGKDLDAWYFNPSTIFIVFFLWLMFFPGEMAVNLHLLGGIAKSHYELKSLSAVFEYLIRGFLPAGGITVFLQSESASLALMILSCTVTMYFQFSSRTGEELLDKAAYVFAVKPLVRLIAMFLVFGVSTVFSAERLPAVVTVAVLAFAMILIDQRIELIDHDFGPAGKGDPRFATPHGALLNFGFQIALIIMSAGFLIQAVVAEKQFERILKNPVKVNGVIAGTHLPDEERYSIVAQKYWWFIDVEYRALNDPSKSYIIREVKTLFDSGSDPKGKHMRVIYEAGNPRNAFIDVYEDRQKPGLLFRQGIILFVLGLAAWWGIGRFMHG